MSGRGGPRKRKAAPSYSSAPDSPASVDDYALKRQKNNVAVCKTRQKKRQEEQDTNTRVNQLKMENESLER